MNRIHKLISILLSLILVLGCFPVAAMAAEFPDEVFTPDGTPPTITSLKVPETAEAGKTVEIIMTATDDLSGVSYGHLYFICEETGRSLYCNLNQSRYDEEKGYWVEYPAGELHGTLSIDPYVPNGTYTLYEVFAYDNADNELMYSNFDYRDEEYAKIPASLQASFQIVNKGTVDKKPPVMTDLKVSGTVASATENVEIVLKGSDDLSGLNYASAVFYCKETNTYCDAYLESSYFNPETGNYDKLPDGELRGEIYLDSHVKNGTYELVEIYLNDKAENHHSYWVDCLPEHATENSSPLPAYAQGIKVQIKYDGPQALANIKIKNVTLEQIKMTRPGTIEFVAKTDGDVNKLRAISIQYTCKETGKRLNVWMDKEQWDPEKQDYVILNNGEVCGEMYVNKYLLPGIFELSRVSVEDMDGNYTTIYDSSKNDTAPAYITETKLYIGTAASQAPDYVKPTEPKPTEPAPTPTEPAPTEPAPTEPAEPEAPVAGTIFRVEGSNRYETAFQAANVMKQALGISKFSAIIVASGKEFPDALAGSYLAAQKNAPILLVNSNMIDKVRTYIQENLAGNGIVYLLGGKSAVPAEMETALAGIPYKRLEGSNRYGTNLEILKEAGISGDEILICTGKGFADSLSASAVNKPILLVNNKSLMADQKAFLQQNPGKKLVIIGGESAVSKAMYDELGAYGKVERVAGSNRYDTSIEVAKRFFNNPTIAVLAYAKNFPDGLCGGPLASVMNAPLILTATGKESAADAYAKTTSITTAVVLGGEGLISTDSVVNILIK